MQTVQDVFSVLVPMAILSGFVGFFIYVSLRLRRGGGSLTTVILGATDEFLTQERSKAAETIVNENAGKKLEEQSSGHDKPGDNASGPQVR
jgi:hypothetical protein